MKAEREPCPYCSELILSDAEKCRFCGEWLVENHRENDKHKLGDGVIRLVQVASILGYILFFCFAIFGAYLAYESKPLVQAPLTCDDGTEWNAVDSTWGGTLSSAEMCGLCTKRTSGNKYVSCDYGDPRYYDSYTVSEEYGWNWWTIGVPVLILLIGWGVVDFIKISLYYVFAGKSSIHQSFTFNVVSFLLALTEEKHYTLEEKQQIALLAAQSKWTKILKNIIIKIFLISVLLIVLSVGLIFLVFLIR